MSESSDGYREEKDEVFEQVVEKLNEHDIPWWVTYGSLLGAFREGKRIDWDYDYDIAYPIQYAPEVLEAILEIPDVFINRNLHFSVVSKEDREHMVCLMPHVFTEKGVYRVCSPMRYYTKKANKLELEIIPNAYQYITSVFIRLLPLKIQKVITKFEMLTYVHVELKGKKDDYSFLYESRMGDVKVKVPVGVENILERLYGDDFMTPKRKGEY